MLGVPRVYDRRSSLFALRYFRSIEPIEIIVMKILWFHILSIPCYSLRYSRKKCVFIPYAVNNTPLTKVIILCNVWTTRNCEQCPDHDPFLFPSPTDSQYLKWNMTNCMRKILIEEIKGVALLLQRGIPVDCGWSPARHGCPVVRPRSVPRPCTIMVQRSYMM